MAKIKVQSVKDARAKAQRQSNGYIQKWGENDWAAALITLYSGGGVETFKKIQEMPFRWQRLFIDAHNYMLTELELIIASAAASANMEKKDRKKYFSDLQSRLMGNK